VADARAVLTARGVHCVLDLAHVELAPEVDAAFAVMVREAVTNVLRHSGARRCRITLSSQGRSAVLTVANDGADPQPVRPAGGSGIGNLRDRAVALDGTVSTILDLDGWFRLVAEPPAHPPR
jgi:signal transduction histidine kinase